MKKLVLFFLLSMSALAQWATPPVSGYSALNAFLSSLSAASSVSVLPATCTVGKDFAVLTTTNTLYYCDTINHWTAIPVSVLNPTANLSDLSNAATARTNLGLGNVDNTADANKPVSTLQATAISNAQSAAQAASLPLHGKADTSGAADTAASATNISGGSAGQYPYQTGVGTTGFRTPNAANGPVVLGADGSASISGTVLRGGGASLPATCSVGDQYFLLTGTTGNYVCTATNTWALPGGIGYPTAGLPISTGTSWGSSLTPGAAGHVVRSNGTVYQDAGLQAGDIPALPYEQPLGNPSLDNQVLASTAAGVRSWKTTVAASTITHTYSGAGSMNFVHNLGTTAPGIVCVSTSGSAVFSASAIDANTTSITVPGPSTLTCTFSSSPTSSTDPGYKYYRQIVVSAASVPADAANFPVLVSITDPTLKSVANGGHVHASAGWDIGFSTDNAAASPLGCEVERYDPTTGTLMAWVNVSLTHASGGTFYLTYGDSFVGTSPCTGTATWNSNFAAVWHLGNGTVLSGSDSTTNANNVWDAHQTSTSTSGKIDGAASFNGTSNYMRVLSSSSLQGMSQLTACAWVNGTNWTNAPAFVDKPVTDGTGAVDPYQLWQLGIADSTGHVFFAVSSGSAGSRVVLTSTEVVSTGALHYVCGVYNGTTMYTFIDGVQGATTAAAAVTIGTNSIDARIGGLVADGTNAYMNGIIDEVRLSNTGRSASWISMEYSSMNTPASFAVVGIEQSH